MLPVRHRPILLASTSPRRRELLRQAGIDFALVEPGPEPVGSGSPEQRAMQRAASKARGATVPSPGLVLGVDTVVALDDQEFGKPADRSAAASMLRRLMGREHDVLTAHCLVATATGRHAASCARARVRCRELAPPEQDAYLDVGDWHDKAGGYGIQSAARSFMELVTGELDTVIGLNVATVRQLLAALAESEDTP